MIIGVTINNILRDHIKQLTSGYIELTGKEPIEPINPFDLLKSFPKQESTVTISEFNIDKPVEFTQSDNDNEFDVYDFIYNEASFEIFGRADESLPGIIAKLDDIQKKNGVEIILLNKESPRSRCATLFFLSKNNFNFKKIIFPEKYVEFWDYVDVMITDNPKVLAARPNGKIVIKVANDYNTKYQATYTIKGIEDIRTLNRIIRTLVGKNKKKRWKKLKQN